MGYVFRRYYETGHGLAVLTLNRHKEFVMATKEPLVFENRKAAHQFYMMQSQGLFYGISLDKVWIEGPKGGKYSPWSRMHEISYR